MSLAYQELLYVLLAALDVCAKRQQPLLSSPVFCTLHTIQQADWLLTLLSRHSKISNPKALTNDSVWVTIETQLLLVSTGDCTLIKRLKKKTGKSIYRSGQGLTDPARHNQTDICKINVVTRAMDFGWQFTVGEWYPQLPPGKEGWVDGFRQGRQDLSSRSDKTDKWSAIEEQSRVDE